MKILGIYFHDVFEPVTDKNFVKREWTVIREKYGVINEIDVEPEFPLEPNEKLKDYAETRIKVLKQELHFQKN